MKRIVLAATAVAASVLAAAPANAVAIPVGSNISLNGYVTATPTGGNISQATGLDFNTVFGTPSPGTPGVLSSYGAGTGVFAGITCSNPAGCGTIQDIASLVVGAQTINNFVILTGGTNVNPIMFTLLGIDAIGRGTPDVLTFSGSGTINYSGFDPTPGSFIFTAQGGTITSFSATTLARAVPEPATWGMMLLGFAGIGFAMRRRRQPALAQLA